MRIDGKALSDTILIKLSDMVSTLKKADITPALAVILVGDDQASVSYIREKQKAAQRIGATLIREELLATTSTTTLESAIAHYNSDPTVHGLIVQRPVPMRGVGETLNSVSPAKDVDGFIPHSPFEAPIARAVITILEHIHEKLLQAELIRQEFKPWLNSQSIAIIGRGETAGKPIADVFKKYNCATSIIHSKTTHPEKILTNATVIISCVGKKDIVRKNQISPGAILLSVGSHREKDGKLIGDYEEGHIADVASFYTPTPGGVGPVNVACLMQNLVDACIMSLDTTKGVV